MLRNKKGVSLITLIITIIVVIILAVIVMRGTGGTIEQANYSSYMDDLGKVKEAVKTKAMEVKGEYLIEGRTVSMEEIYNYVAKGGKTGDDFLGKVNVPAYTIIDRENADIGIEIPTRNIESGTARNVEIQYIVTKEGEVFAWPPYEYEDKLYITENVMVAGKLDKDLQIEDESFTLDLDATLGTVLPTEETSGGENGESGSGNGGTGDGEQGGTTEPTPATYTITFNSNGGLGEMASVTQEENTIYVLPECTYTAPSGYTFKSWLVNEVSKPVGASVEVIGNIEVKAEWEVISIEVGDFVTYESDLGTIECRVWEKKSNGDMVIMPTAPVGSWKLVCDSNSSANSAKSYIVAEDEIDNLCKEYVSEKLGVSKENITGLTKEELSEKVGYTPTIGQKYAYYLYGTSVSGITTTADGLAGYTKRVHSDVANVFGNKITRPTFYTYDYAKSTTTDSNGNRYAYISSSSTPVFVTNTHYTYNPSTVSEDTVIYGEMLGDSFGWLASTSVACNDEYVGFIVNFVNKSMYGGFAPFFSNGSGFNGDWGVRPLITLSSTLKLDNSVSGMDGTQTNPWIFTK